MNDRPTPETDAEFPKLYDSATEWVDAAFARRLERERDEARDELREWADAAASAENPHPDEAHCTCVPLLTASLKQARDKHARSIIEWGKELAEAQAQRDRLAEALRPFIDGWSDKSCDSVVTDRQFRDAKQALAAVKGENDE
jgi:hypothetical protein